MSASLKARLKLVLDALYESPLDLGVASYPALIGADYNLDNGSGANQASLMFSDIRTLTASSTENLDLAGSLVDAFGTTLTFAKIKALIVIADAGNTNDVLVGGAGSNTMLTFFGDATDIVKVKPGGMLVLVAPDATGYAVTASTGDILKVANSSSGTGVTYKIILIGA